MAQTAKVLLPQFNYWELSSKLIQSPELAEQLDVNPDQIAALKAMRARPAFRTLLEVKTKELRTDARFGGFSAETLAWNQLDDVVKKEMSEIFAATQLSGLRRLILRQYYPFGFSPFEEINVRRYIDLPQADSAALDAAVTEKSILDVVDAEWKITTASLSNLQNEIFAELVQTLRKEKQPQMRAFFADVW